MKTRTALILGLPLLCGPALPADAEYTLILKNGRRITVETYREESGTIKFNGLGGEIGISKDQIQTIRRGEAAEPGDFDVSRTKAVSSADDIAVSAQEGGLAKSAPEQERVREEQEYQAKLKDLETRLKAAHETYLESVRGNAGEQPVQAFSEEQTRNRQDDVSARFKDAQNNPSEPAPVKLLNPSPFSSLPPTVTDVQPAGRAVSPYETPQTLTPREQELLQLRERTLELERERERLLKEMKERNVTPGVTGQ